MNQPLEVFMVWHSDSKLGKTLGEEAFRRWHRDTSDPMAPAIEAPVWFWTQPAPGGQVPAPISASADQAAIFVLIDNAMLLDAAVWGPYVQSLWDDAERAGNAKVFLVALAAPYHASNLCAATAEQQLIRFPMTLAEAEQIEFLFGRMTNELCRLLLWSGSESGSRVQIFLSHAKLDGLAVAESLQAYIYTRTQLESFFDAYSIGVNEDWADRLTDSASGSAALLAIRTDQYGGRDWCQREVLLAKQSQVPVVVLDAFANREHRSFPYLGNVPVVRWTEDLVAPPFNPWRCEVALNAVLSELLRKLHFEALVEARHGLSGPGSDRLLYPPELATALYARAARSPGITGAPGSKRVIYPDPPISRHELELLAMLDPDTSFVPASEY